jgi:hypothetical protein
MSAAFLNLGSGRKPRYRYWQKYENRRLQQRVSDRLGIGWGRSVLKISFGETSDLEHLKLTRLAASCSFRPTCATPWPQMKIRSSLEQPSARGTHIIPKLITTINTPFDSHLRQQPRDLVKDYSELSSRMIVIFGWPTYPDRTVLSRDKSVRVSRT